MSQPSAHLNPLNLAFAALIIGIAWDILFFKHVPGISVPIFFLIALGGIALFDRLTHKHMSWNEVWLSFLILILSSFYAIRASEFLMALNAIAIVYLSLLLLANLYGAKTKKYQIHDFFLFPLLDNLYHVIQSLDIVANLHRTKSSTNRRVIFGLAAAAIFAVIFIGLFISADLVIQNYINDIFSENLVQNAIEHSIVVLFFSSVALVLVAPIFWKRSKPREIIDHEPSKDFGLEAMIVFIVSNVLFTGFLAVQAVYLFGGERNLEVYNLTYSEYAREGFFQLLVVALIVAAMIWGMRLIQSGKQKTANKILQVLLIGQACAVLASSWMRLGLYEEVYGFTYDRLFSHYFLIVIAVILILLLLGILVKLQNSKLLHGIVFVFAIALIGLNLINPDAFIAHKNIERGEDGYEIDYKYLFMLSDDAVPVIAEKSAWSGLERAIKLSKQGNLRYDEIQARINETYTEARTAAPERRDALNSERQALYDEMAELNYDLLLEEKSQKWLEREITSEWQAWNLARLNASHIRTQLLIEP